MEQKNHMTKSQRIIAEYKAAYHAANGMKADIYRRNGRFVIVDDNGISWTLAEIAQLAKELRGRSAAERLPEPAPGDRDLP